MTPLTTNPTVVIRINEDGDVLDMATNVAPDLTVEVVYTKELYKKLACNKPFDTTRPVAVN